jgi:hypothetical protein
MDKVILYDTLDLLSGFIADSDQYWTDRAGVVVRSLSGSITTQLLAFLGVKKKVDSLDIAKVATALRDEYLNNWVKDTLTYLNNLPESARRDELAEFCRQRFLRPEQEGYDEQDAIRAMQALAAAGINVPQGVV